MNIVLFQNEPVKSQGERMLLHLVQHPLLASMVEWCHARISAQTLLVLPTSMASNACFTQDFRKYSETEQVMDSWIPPLGPSSWVCISQGACVTEIDEARVASLLSKTKASVVCLGVDEKLAGHRELIRYTSDGRIVGFRRHYEDSVEVVPLFEAWPHRLYLRNSCVPGFASLPLEFNVFLELCRTHHLDIESYAMAGLSYDLNTAQGLIGLVRLISRDKDGVQDLLKSVPEYQCLDQEEHHSGIGPRASGRVWVSRTSRVSPDAVLVSPLVISDHVHVESKAVVESSILGPNVRVKERTLVSKNVFGHDMAQEDEFWDSPPQKSRFRQWHGYAYINTLKRAVDIGIALMVLILFLPIFPLIALAIKINSPGPIFYKARRQGLYGREFGCLKFRTMKVGSDQLQDKLRAINEVDGPQFKMADDPRISSVGHFLRETYLDEIPQFINVLKGEMSVVGPRPSPKSENTQCPRWRDARLSVRPGVTGLWQLLRTREPLRDFQEWIHYDIEYVKRLSARLDLWICWRTFLQMLGKFVEQF